MRDFGIPNRTADTHVLRDAPELVNLVQSVQRKYAVSENQTPAVVYPEVPGRSGNVVPLRRSETTSSGAERIVRVIRIHGRPIRRNHRPVVNDDVVDGFDVPPVHGFIETAAVVDEHHGEASAEEPRPLDSGHRDIFPIQFVYRRLIKISKLIIFNPLQGKTVLHRLLCRGINDSGEKPVVLVEHFEDYVIYRRLGLVIILLGVVLRSSVPVYEIGITIKTRGAYRLSRLLSQNVFISLHVPSHVFSPPRLLKTVTRRRLPSSSPDARLMRASLCSMRRWRSLRESGHPRSPP